MMVYDVHDVYGGCAVVVVVGKIGRQTLGIDLGNGGEWDHRVREGNTNERRKLHRIFF
jgi:hypothetical protein